jgi:hypothetical protein
MDLLSGELVFTAGSPQTDVAKLFPGGVITITAFVVLFASTSGNVFHDVTGAASGAYRRVHRSEFGVKLDY